MHTLSLGVGLAALASLVGASPCKPHSARSSTLASIVTSTEDVATADSTTKALTSDITSETSVVTFISTPAAESTIDTTFATTIGTNSTTKVWIPTTSIATPTETPYTFANTTTIKTPTIETPTAKTTAAETTTAIEYTTNTPVSTPIATTFASIVTTNSTTKAWIPTTSIETPIDIPTTPIGTPTDIPTTPIGTTTAISHTFVNATTPAFETPTAKTTFVEITTTPVTTPAQTTTAESTPETPTSTPAVTTSAEISSTLSTSTVASSTSAAALATFTASASGSGYASIDGRTLQTTGKENNALYLVSSGFSSPNYAVGTIHVQDSTGYLMIDDLYIVYNPTANQLYTAKTFDTVFTSDWKKIVCTSAYSGAALSCAPEGLPARTQFRVSTGAATYLGIRLEDPSTTTSGYVNIDLLAGVAA